MLDLETNAHSIFSQTQEFSTVHPLDLVCTYEFLQEYLLDPKDLLLDDALVYLRRNLVCDKVPNLSRNLTESFLKEEIQTQSISTCVLDSLSVLTLATGI